MWRAGRPSPGGDSNGMIDSFMLNFAEYYDRDGNDTQ